MTEPKPMPGTPCAFCPTRCFGGAWAMGIVVPDGYSVCRKCAGKIARREPVHFTMPVEYYMPEDVVFQYPRVREVNQHALP